jgi:acetyltransferase-like isoleucine patch superfamily enzyme
MKLIGYCLKFFSKAILKIYMYAIRSLFKEYGENVVFCPYDYFSFSTISLGNDVYIGPGANFSSIKSITIGSKVLFGPNVTIMGGDHNTSMIGKYMFDVKDKLYENDLPIIINDDVWIGTGVIILKGVTIGEGSIVAAGSLVNKNIPPYTIVAGVPARIIKKRFSESQIKKHIHIISENQVK